MYTSDSPQLIPSGQVVTGQILDGVMAGYLGKTSLSITFDKGPQIAPESAGPGTFAHIVADFPAHLAFGSDFEPSNVPLLLSYVPSPGAGRVIYTNFHNDAQTTEDMVAILEYLVFTL